MDTLFIEFLGTLNIHGNIQFIYNIEIENNSINQKGKNDIDW